MAESKHTLSLADYVAIIALIGGALATGLPMIAITRSLILLFALGGALFLCYRVPWRRWKRIFAAVAAVCIYLAVVLVLFDQEAKAGNTVAPTTSLIQTALNVLRNVPWRWVIPGFVLGAGLSGLLLTLYQLSVKNRSETRDNGAESLSTWDRLAESDKASIKNLVKIVYIFYIPDFEKFHIDFAFGVFNNSLYDIMIDNSLQSGSYIMYGPDHSKFHYPAKITIDQAIYCPSRWKASFVVRQPIRQEGPERQLQEADNVDFLFHGLNINFQGAPQFPEIGVMKLDTQHYLETRKRFWSGDNPQIVFGLTEEQWAAVRSGDAGRLLELEGLRSKLLKEKDSEVSTLPDIIAHDPYFAWVGKETQVGKYIKIGSDFDRYNDVRQAAFLDLYLRPIPGTNSPVDISATIVFKGEKYDRRVNAGVWYGRDAAKVPLRRNETQTLFILLYDGAFFTYEHQYKNRPLAAPMSTKTVYAHIHVFGEYEETKTINLNLYARLSMDDDSHTIEKLDENAFKAATELL